jgi:hypothetical protein
MESGPSPESRQCPVSPRISEQDSDTGNWQVQTVHDEAAPTEDQESGNDHCDSPDKHGTRQGGGENQEYLHGGQKMLKVAVVPDAVQASISSAAPPPQAEQVETSVGLWLNQGERSVGLTTLTGISLFEHGRHSPSMSPKQFPRLFHDLRLVHGFASWCVHCFEFGSIFFT